jgi:hypothetical protein
MTNVEPIKFKADIMWAFLTAHNPLAQRYTVDLCNLGEEAVDALERAGISVLSKPEKPEKGKYITCKSTLPMVAETTSGSKITEAVGNGSKAVAIVRPYQWDFKGKKGISPTVLKLRVTDLKAYTALQGADDSLDDDIL